MTEQRRTPSQDSHDPVDDRSRGEPIAAPPDAWPEDPWADDAPIAPTRESSRVALRPSAVGRAGSAPQFSAPRGSGSRMARPVAAASSSPRLESIAEPDDWGSRPGSSSGGRIEYAPPLVRPAVIESRARQWSRMAVIVLGSLVTGGIGALLVAKITQYGESEEAPPVPRVAIAVDPPPMPTLVEPPPAVIPPAVITEGPPPARIVAPAKTVAADERPRSHAHAKPRPEPEEAPEPEPVKAEVPEAPLVKLPEPEPPRPAPAAPPPAPRAGTIDVAATRAAVRSQIGPVQQCYERARMDDTSLAGTVTTRITIAADGSVARVEIVKSTLGAPQVEACIRDGVARWHLPKPSGGAAASLTYPLVFQ